MLYDENILQQKPSPGKCVLDSDPTEASRHSSLFSHFMRVPHKKNFLLHVSDTPYGDFPSDAMSALDGSDSSILVISAADGVQSNTINAYNHCKEVGIKTLVALSKMDRPFLNISEVLQSIEEQLGIKPVPLQVPVGEGEGFSGVLSLFEVDKNGMLSRNKDGATDNAWSILEEAVAMTSDDLLIEFLDNGSIEDDAVLAGLRNAIVEQKILPLVYTSAIQDVGVSQLMDAVVAFLPSPIEARKSTLEAAFAAAGDELDKKPGEEGGFAARVLHTTIDAFGSLSIVRIISNSRDETTGKFKPLPHEVINLRTGEKIKLSSTCFGLCGKQRQMLADYAQFLPGDVIALPKVSIETNDIICTQSAVKDEEYEIEVESFTHSLSPLSRPVVETSLMASATIALAEASGKKGRKQSGSGDDKLINALSSLSREDLGLKVEQESGQWIIRCMSKDHLNLIVERLKDRYDLDVDVGETPIAYRETITRAITNVEGKHKKQSGGSGQFGVCYITVEPLAEGSGVEFGSTVKGGAISKTFINSIEKGVMEQLSLGGPLGFPVTDVKVTVTDGKMHSVDSKDIAFQSAGRQAVKNALEQAGTLLLQPMEKVKFIVDEKLQGEINGIVSRSDGYVTDSNLMDKHLAEVEAIIPAACMSEISETLRAESAGEGQYTKEFSHYQTVPDTQVKTICSKLNP